MDQFQALKETLQKTAPNLELRQAEPMSQHTTFCIGGPVPLMALPQTEEEAITAVRAASALGLEPFFLGNGSNLLVADEGADVFVIKTASLNGLSCEEENITAGSGVLLSQLANFALEHSLDGLEFVQGIPGSVGGAITMNAGAYNGEMAQVVQETAYVDKNGMTGTLTGAEHDFSYRHSTFSDENRLILHSRMHLKKDDPAMIKTLMDNLAGRRRFKQPLEFHSAGSTFKRPKNYYAGALIDECHLKGLTVGNAQVSIKHAGFIVNLGGATCKDVLALANLVRETVLRDAKVELELEIKTLGVKA
ncbi:MAG: UDP-N-acetylmuramate dehydrogenase [Intestinimonas sp.]|nr:UDP-N-acetylmuramate dehydrogenase [Intestinimonas sp.]